MNFSCFLLRSLHILHSVLCTRAVNNRLKNQFVYIETHSARAVLCEPAGSVSFAQKTENKRKMIRQKKKKSEMFCRLMPECRYLRNRKAIWMMNTDSFWRISPFSRVNAWNDRPALPNATHDCKIKSMKLMISTCSTVHCQKKKNNIAEDKLKLCIRLP